jgi:hypothetical protein
MPWNFRRSSKFGPFRITISSSGISSSVGFGGVRLTSSKRGTYVSASSGGGFYFRERIDAPKRKASQPPLNTAPAAMQEIASDDASGMVAHSVILERINANERRGAWLPWVGIFIAAFLTFGSYGIGFPIPGLIAGLACVGLCFWIRSYLRSASPVELEYQLNDEEKRRYETLQTALASLAKSQRLWQINAFGNTNDWKRNAGANQLVQRSNSQVGRGTPRSFRSNIEVLSLKLARETLYFLPDMLFVQQRKAIGTVFYPSLTVADAVTRFNETEGVPSDAQQVGTTWRYVNKNGGPDRRFNNNRQIPIALYGEVAIRMDSGLRVALMTSSVEAAKLFATGMRAIQQLAPTNMLYLCAPSQ